MTALASQLNITALLEQAARLSAQAGGVPMTAARLAQHGGQPELARALLARTGGLFDTAEAERLLRPEQPARSAGGRRLLQR